MTLRSEDPKNTVLASVVGEFDIGTLPLFLDHVEWLANRRRFARAECQTIQLVGSLPARYEVFCGVNTEKAGATATRYTFDDDPLVRLIIKDSEVITYDAEEATGTATSTVVVRVGELFPHCDSAA